MAPDDTQVRGGESPEQASKTQVRDDTAQVPPANDTNVRAEPMQESSGKFGSGAATAPRPISPTPPSARQRPAAESSASAASVSLANPLIFGEGYKLRGRYLLEQLIGQGAMGRVWRAKDLLSEEARDRNPYIAVKVLNSSFESHPDAFVAMHREASRVQKLAHPNIGTVYAFDRDDQSGRAFIAMELLEGRPLDRVIREAGPAGLPRAEALPVIRAMAEGLAYAHRKGIVHSDFKPANVFLASDGTPKILDFGIARAIQVADQASGERAPSDADDSLFQGYTPSYAAPEALTASEPSTAEDVFALGIVSYELLTGRHPFNRRSALEARSAGITPQPLHGLKRRESQAIAKALAFERSERFPDAAAFNKAMQGIAPIQKALAAVVAVLAITAGFLWYRSYLESQPVIPFEQLPVQVQRDIRDVLRQGDESLQYLERSHDITASADAAQYFAEAYALHPRNPDATAGLERAADYAIDWYNNLPDRGMALEELQKFKAKSDFYLKYPPLQDAIESLQEPE